LIFLADPIRPVTRLSNIYASQFESLTGEP
jgi:hypothetical protein